MEEKNRSRAIRTALCGISKKIMRACKGDNYYMKREIEVKKTCFLLLNEVNKMTIKFNPSLVFFFLRKGRIF